MKSAAPPTASSATGALILVLGGSEVVLRGLSEIGRRHGWILRRSEVVPDALDQIESEMPTLVLCDAAWWNHLQPLLSQRLRGIPVVVFTPLADEDLWLEVMEAGAYDMLSAPFSERELAHTVCAAQRALSMTRAAAP